jgi:formimidoylglutamate deiminase
MTSIHARAALLDSNWAADVRIEIARGRIAQIETGVQPRPVAWLLDHAPADPRWCLIHATHMTDAETTALARTGAVCGLCPVTKANLGDGIFNAAPFVAAHGRFGIGTDSNILIDAAGELRQLEYSQRLARRQRNVLGVANGSTGRALYDRAVEGGAQALGVAPPTISEGAAADLVSLDPDAFAGIGGDGVLDAWIFVSRRMIDGVSTGGAKRVAHGRHVDREPVTARFKAVLREVAHA